ncbi:hypothetical protein NPIL_302901 [Nephila pilipes]|uniref:Uncharacterized protein n=1 Tax=Nephila pilipes TaxID=299642 RepID=A0A8X6T4D5_NEPPI|nr:hypothetical protein NPIL_302901 [Nephila pilipes]
MKNAFIHSTERQEEVPVNEDYIDDIEKVGGRKNGNQERYIDNIMRAGEKRKDPNAANTAVPSRFVNNGQRSKVLTDSGEDIVMTVKKEFHSYPAREVLRVAVNKGQKLAKAITSQFVDDVGWRKVTFFIQIGIKSIEKNKVREECLFFEFFKYRGGSSSTLWKDE